MITKVINADGVRAHFDSVFLSIFQEARIVRIAAPFIDYVLAWNLTKDVQLAGRWPLA